MRRWFAAFVLGIWSLLTASAAETFADRLAPLQSRLRSDPTNALLLFQLPVCEVTENLRVEPNHVYVIPPNAGMIMEQGALRLPRRQMKRGAHRAIDHFFESLAQGPPA